MDNLNNENVNEEVLEDKTEELAADEKPTEELFNPEEDSFFGGGDNTYVKKADKYDDVRSSAFTMLIVGVLGIIFVTLLILNVIKIPFNPATAWLFYGIMIVVFVAFIVAGILSYMKSIRLNEEAEIENKKIDEIKKWANENLTEDKVDSGLDKNESVEILYFTRAERIKSALMHQFEDVDEGLIDLLTENIYTKMYEDDEAFDEEYEYEEEIIEEETSEDE